MPRNEVFTPPSFRGTKHSSDIIE